MATLLWKVGDVFTVPLDQERVGIGQIAATYGEHEYYFAIFDLILPRTLNPNIDQALSSPLVFLALSMDAQLYHRQWVVIDNRPVADDLPLPAYKESRVIDGEIEVIVVDYSGKRHRLAVGAEADVVPNRTTVAPVRLEKALRAKHGLEPWIDAYDLLRPNPLITTTRLFGK